MRMLLLALMLNVLPPAAILAAVPPPANAPPQDLDALRDKMDASKAAGDREKLPGAAVYREHCRICHEGQAPKAPSRTFLQMMTPEAIDRALTVGIMQRQAATLTADDKKFVAEYLSGLPFGAPEPPEAPPVRGRGRALRSHPRARHRRLGIRSREHAFHRRGFRAACRCGYPAARGEMDLRLSRFRSRAIASHLRLRRAVRRQPERHRVCARCQDRVHPLDVRNERRGPHARRDTCDRRPDQTRLLRRHRRSGLRGRRAHRQGTLAGSGGRSSERDDHRSAGVLPGHRLCRRYRRSRRRPPIPPMRVAPFAAASSPTTPPPASGDGSASPSMRHRMNPE